MCGYHFDSTLQQFSETGIPEVISSDNASNFRGKLITEFLNRLGCTPRFSTPAHPQACGLVERLVGSIKGVVSKIAAEHPKQWYFYLPAVLWALREAPIALLVPPWLLAFGRLPRGPLAVLKDTWSGQVNLPFNLGKNVTEYLKDLRDRLATAEQYAFDHTTKQQAAYITRYNWRQHLSHLELFLQQVKQSGFTLNLKKCNFALPEVRFVGHIIGSGCRRADPDKLSAVHTSEHGPPENKKQVRQILAFFRTSESTSQTLHTLLNPYQTSQGKGIQTK